MIAFCTIIFAPAGRLLTFHQFKKQFEALGLPLFVAELSFNGTFESHRLGIKEVGDERNVLWQKEALLNELVDKLPPEYDQVCFIDCDMVWPDAGWIEEAQKQIKKYRAVQLFEKTLYFDRDGGISHATYGWAAHKGHYNPGGAWLVRRELFPLIDYMIVGGGDRIMAEGWAGTGLSRTRGFRNNWKLLKKLKADMDAQFAKCQGKIGFVDLPNYHLFHGELSKRHYIDRMSCLGDYWFNPDTDVTRENGMLAWTKNARPELKEFVANYFKERVS